LLSYSIKTKKVLIKRAGFFKDLPFKPPLFERPLKRDTIKTKIKTLLPACREGLGVRLCILQEL
jgi:hypothetical protein